MNKRNEHGHAITSAVSGYVQLWEVYWREQEDTRLYVDVIFGGHVYRITPHQAEQLSAALHEAAGGAAKQIADELG